MKDFKTDLTAPSDQGFKQRSCSRRSHWGSVNRADSKREGAARESWVEAPVSPSTGGREAGRHGRSLKMQSSGSKAERGVRNELSQGLEGCEVYQDRVTREGMSGDGCTCVKIKTIQSHRLLQMNFLVALRMCKSRLPLYTISPSLVGGGSHASVVRPAEGANVA